MSLTRVVTAMAMDFTIDVDGLPEADAVEAVEAAHRALIEADQTFSLWQDDSPMSSLNRGDLTLDDCGDTMREVISSCEWYRDLTGGAFDARRPDGGWDPTGLVKGWAVQRAGLVLDDAGAADWFIGAAGDVVCKDNGAWRRIGIADPRIAGDPAGTAVLDVIEIGGRLRALATSGNAQHPGHIWDPTTGQAATHMTQVSVLGPDLVECDVFATAIMAGGMDVVSRAQQRSLEVLVVGRDRGDGTFAAHATPGWPSVRPAREAPSPRA